MSEAVRTDPLAPAGTARPREPSALLRATVGEPALLDLPRGPLHVPVRTRFEKLAILSRTE